MFVYLPGNCRDYILLPWHVPASLLTCVNYPELLEDTLNFQMVAWTIIYPSYKNKCFCNSFPQGDVHVKTTEAYNFACPVDDACLQQRTAAVVAAPADVGWTGSAGPQLQATVDCHCILWLLCLFTGWGNVTSYQQALNWSHTGIQIVPLRKTIWGQNWRSCESLERWGVLEKERKYIDST